MNKNDYLKMYAEKFKYQKLEFKNQLSNQITYLRDVGGSIMSISANLLSDYAKFNFKNKEKIFKKSDLFLCALESVPAAWEEEGE